MSDAVLIIDDSLTFRMDLAEAFEAASERVVLAASVAEGATRWRGGTSRSSSST